METEESRIYQVVINIEEQYSIWFLDVEIPDGWRSIGIRGTKAECLAYIEAHWTDMRPLSIRRALDGSADD